jgi:hypothetical protein
MPPYGARVPAQSTNGFSPKKQQTAARNGYLIVWIRLLDVLPTCWRYCQTAAFRPVKGTSPNVSSEKKAPDISHLQSIRWNNC